MFFIRKKLSKEELGERPLDKKGLKQGKALLKGVRKFLRYNDDLVSEERKAEISAKYDAFATALADRTAKRKDLESLAEDLTEYCKKSVKDYKASAWKENIEVVFVAVVIAMGIRAYFIQQFKIPTGSMQPTLNGIIAYPAKEMNTRAEYYAPDDYERPSLPQRVWEKFWNGRSHVQWTAKEDDFILLDKNHLYDRNVLIFFPRTYLITQKGHKFSAPGTLSRVENLIRRDSSGMGRIIPVKKGETIAKGFLETGDQLVVNKWIYHFKKPERGEVFVFDTQNIRGIQVTIDPRHGSQHYIKRLAGTPGDKLEVRPPHLFVNGEEAKEEGFRRVASKEGYYTGYTLQGRSKVGAELGDGEYYALGDNSANSSDSRTWGIVPEENIVGRAAFVYYPFGNHFGFVD